MARAIPYKKAIEWMALNDDTDWLEHDSEPISTVACFVADIYTMPENKVASDLKKAIERIKKNDSR